MLFTLGNSPRVKRYLPQFIKVVQEITYEGYSAQQILEQLLESVIHSDTLSEEQKCKMGGVFGEADKMLLEGGDEQLQLLSFVSQCAEIAAGR